MALTVAAAAVVVLAGCGSSPAAGKADIGASGAFLSPATLATYSSLVNIPLAVAALMVVYNVPGISASAYLRLDGTVLARIFSGKIGRWDDPAIAALNPGVNLPGAAIVPVHRADSSGSTSLFTSYLNADRQDQRLRQKHDRWRRRT